METFREYVAQSSGLRIDTEGAVIHGVKILGSESKNGRSYSHQAMREAINLYEGTRSTSTTSARAKPAHGTTRTGWACCRT